MGGAGGVFQLLHVLAGVKACNGCQLELVTRDQHGSGSLLLQVLHEDDVVVGLDGVPAEVRRQRISGVRPMQSDRLRSVKWHPPNDVLEALKSLLVRIEVGGHLRFGAA